MHGPRWYYTRVTSYFLMRGPRTVVAGIPVHHASVTADRLETVLRQIERALALTQRDLRHWTHLRRDGPAILVVDATTNPKYIPPMNLILLPIGSIVNDPVQLLAVSIVHEATHARIAHATRGLRAMEVGRQERLCQEEGIAFMRRVARPGDPLLEPWVAFERKKLEREWWTRANRQKAYAEQLKADGAPAWAIWIAKMMVP
jgi:hypothetical protein